MYATLKNFFFSYSCLCVIHQSGHALIWMTENLHPLPPHLITVPLDSPRRPSCSPTFLLHSFLLDTLYQGSAQIIFPSFKIFPRLPFPWNLLYSLTSPSQDSLLSVGKSDFSWAFWHTVLTVSPLLRVPLVSLQTCHGWPAGGRPAASALLRPACLSEHLLGTRYWSQCHAFVALKF